MPNGRGHAGAGRREGQGSGKVLPSPNPVQYFEDPDKQVVRAALLDKEAEELAQKLRPLPPSQLRRFYDHVQTIDRKLRLEAGGGEKEREAVFARLRPELLTLKAKAAYAHGRKTVPKALLQFIVDHTHGVKDSRDFEAFRRQFEAVVAFHGFFAEKE